MIGRGFRQAIRGAAVAAAALAVGAFATAWDGLANAGEKRVALVIGNAAYQDVGALENPIQDAKGMSAALKRLGFDVVEGYDLKYDGMRAVVGEYARKLDGAKAALVYYAGHGVSVSGENYLLPTDAQLKSEADLDLKTVNIDLVMRQMQREDRVSIVILDACRNNPFKEELARSVSRTRSAAVGSGLAEISTKSASGMLIAFATDPGRTALDGDKGGNSPFAAGLLKHMETPGISISTVLDRVRGEVFNTTGGKQKPWTNTSLIGEFFLTQAQAPSEARIQVAAAGDVTLPVSSNLGGNGNGNGAPGMPQTLEMRLWESAEKSNTVEDYKVYLQSHPNGYFAQIAKNRVAAISGRSPTPPAAEPVKAVQTVSDADLAKEIGTAKTETAIKWTPSERKEAQERLKALGFEPGRVSPEFQPETRKAIAEWQSSRSIAETGYLTKVQRTALWEQSEVNFQKMVAAPAMDRGLVSAPAARATRAVGQRQQAAARPQNQPQARQPRPVRPQDGGGGGGTGNNPAAAAAFGGLVGGILGGAVRGRGF